MPSAPSTIGLSLLAMLAQAGLAQTSAPSARAATLAPAAAEARAAQRRPAGAGRDTIPGLGTLDFPVTTSSDEARNTFLRGALLLHVFHYSEAAAAFREAERLDPDFAMAYWGEAMTHTHPVWNQQDLEAGRAALAGLGPTPEARRARAPSEREGVYLDAVEILYGEGTKASRDTAYARTMAGVAAHYPTDDEAQLFYALSLLGLGQGVRDVPTYMKAAAIADGVFARNPEHPGATHYLIHAVDDPVHAVLGLRAARALARSSPEAGHAQHMTSHIFTALGMWDDVVRANEAATGVTNRERAAAGRGPTFCGHYNFWLEYGYLQQGRFGRAKRLLEGCRDQAAQAPAPDGRSPDPDDSAVGSFIQMWARYVIDASDQAGDVAAWQVDPGEQSAARLTTEFVRGLTAARRGDTEGARRALEAYERASADYQARFADRAGTPGFVQSSTRREILGLELQAMVRAAGVRAGRPSAAPDHDASGDLSQAIQLARKASELESSMPYAFGPPFVDLPSAELLGHLLLVAGRPTEARSAFRAALARTPRRASALVGLERAERRSRPPRS
ncbi:MAG: hypothetical protein ACE5HQ_10245 [Gemmatimonadota bacterium]